MKKLELTCKDYISNEEIKTGDVFHGIYEVISEPKITKSGYEWKIHHRRWDVDLRMIRPEPSVFLEMPVHEQQMICSLYQRDFIPMQQHPRIERFYDVRHIGGSTAFFTEWAERGTLTDCMTNGSLYQGTKAEVESRLLCIVAQVARALQFLEDQGIPYGAVTTDNIMITERFNAKLSVANLLSLIAQRKTMSEHSEKKQWAMTALDLFVGEKINRELEDVKDKCVEYANDSDYTVSEKLVELIAGAMYDVLPSWQHVFHYLDAPLTRNYPFFESCACNNHALRLIDCGKWEAAYDMMSEGCRSFEDGFLKYNFLQLHRYASENIITRSYGGIDARMMINEPTDVLLWAEFNNRDMVRRYLDRWGDDVPKSVECYLPEIHEKLLDRPHMTRIDLEPNDPRVSRTDDGILIELDGKKRLFKPLPDGGENVSIPSRDGLVWRKNKLVLPGSGVIEGFDYTVREFEYKSDGSSHMFDEDLEWLLVDEEMLFPLAQYDNRFRSPFLLSTCDNWEDEI